MADELFRSGFPDCGTDVVRLHHPLESRLEVIDRSSRTNKGSVERVLGVYNGHKSKV